MENDIKNEVKKTLEEMEINILKLDWPSERITYQC